MIKTHFEVDEEAVSTNNQSPEGKDRMLNQLFIDKDKSTIIYRSHSTVEHMINRRSTFLEKVKENIYIVYALLCSMSFGFGNYMVAYGMTKWRNSVTILYPEGFTFILCWAVYHYLKRKDTN